MGEDQSELARNPLIADQPTDTLYAVACLLDALQTVKWDELTERSGLGVSLALDVAERALLFELERPDTTVSERI